MVDEAEDINEFNPEDLKSVPIPENIADQLAELQSEIYRYLLAKLKLGKVSHNELAIIRNLLRDNGLVVPPRLAELGNVPRGHVTRVDDPMPSLEKPEWEE